MAQTKRMVLRQADVGFLSRVLSTFPSDYKVISITKGLPNLPEYLNIVLTHNSFPDSTDDVIRGNIKEENGKIKINLDGENWEEQ